MDNENYNNLICVYKNIPNQINNILDAGSGRSSLSSLIDYYNKNIDAIIYPNDDRKKDSIAKNVKGTYNLLEMDICTKDIEKKYDLVLAHLLLGEAITWGNSFESLLRHLLSIDSKYYIIYDYLEDPSIDYKYLELYLKDNNYIIKNKSFFKKNEPQDFTSFIGKTYISYIVERK